MIFYFSGTGNSEYVATRLAEATGEACFSMAECLNVEKCSFRVGDAERVGFVTPVYFWGLPSVVVDFMLRLDLHAECKPFVYHVVTYGTTTGQSHAQMSRLLERKGFSLDGKYIVRMVDVWTPMFNLSDKEKCLRITRKAERQIEKNVLRIQNRVAGNFDYLRVPGWLGRLYYRTYEAERRTSRFRLLTDRCVGCGLCASRCPVHAIKMRSCHPVWTEERCAMCLRCLHHCPKFAIQCGKHTDRHGQFVHPKVK